VSELGEITQLLRLAHAGDKSAESKLLELLYSDLRRLAAAYLGRERRDHTLQPTALLHEAYLRLASQGPKDWKSRSHFLAAAAQAMRHVLVDWARARSAKKRGGRLHRIDLESAQAVTECWPEQLLDLDAALRQLSQQHAQNVAAFESLVTQMAASCKRSPDCVRSWMVGRNTDGLPLMPTSSSKNDFVYDSDPNFQICPAAAHIRKANPRNEDAKGVHILRRGVPYGEGDGPKGLLFQAFASTLENTFEKIMNVWLLNDQFPPVATGPGMDPIIGSRTASPLPSGVAVGSSPSIQSLVTVRAGEYFYFPSIPSFQRLDA
jgi:RNA polymerase sigma factor (TIGR02999 family)